ncbi:MAG: carbonic anhydrase [Acidimicrobiaceae bacterium]|nr:MAG: carbonic anhydrase [Acidimicrobiaceae bacterium]
MDVRSVTDSSFSPNADELIAHNASYVEQFADGGLSLRPRRKLAIVACMDSRMDIFQMLGLAHGDAHIIRNAGGVVTDDVVRSLVVSQRFLGTREIILVHHTNCGLQSVLEDEFKAEIEAETGIRPWWALESFADPFANVAQSMKRLHLSPFIAHKDHMSGFVYDVATGVLHPVG